MTTTALTKSQAAPPATAKPSALKLMASRLSVEPEKLLATLKATAFKGANDEELMALVVVSNEYGLNPFLKEIYAFPAKGGGIVPVVSVDGWNKMLIRQENFDGIEFEHENDSEGKPYASTAIVHIKNRAHPVKVTEYLEECTRNTEPWKNMPRRMLRHRALCQASRLAFGFSGVYNDDEAADVIDVAATKMPTEPPPRLVAPPSDNAITPQQELETIVLGGGFNFGDLKKFGAESGNLHEPDSMSGFADVPSDAARRLVRAKVGLLKSLAIVKDGKNEA